MKSKVDSRVLAVKVVNKYLSELNDVLSKKRLESRDLKRVKRLRELAMLMTTIEKEG